MTDEQFNKLAEALKPHERSNLQRVLDSAFGSVVGLLVAGFTERLVPDLLSRIAKKAEEKT